jgi:hypothetical protein
MRANRGRFEVLPVRTIVEVRRENHIASYLEIISLAEEIKSVSGKGNFQGGGTGTCYELPHERSDRSVVNETFSSPARGVQFTTSFWAAQS